MTMEDAVDVAVRMLRESPDLVQDAQRHRGHSLAGELLSAPFGPVGARWIAEAAVAQALAILQAERRTTRREK